ncbi:YggS family pyridoxal phosphate-dependent enzyme [Sinimarinibacterium thermocellulolyticum]|uniref:Pyridoxal phosphate homeostasis protein n=1 Tax=Sinimarinibacterium thermocellulolyticum TaxID=3170016 RepID=A0ABV2A614_9GAMM
MTRIADRLNAVRARIERACTLAGRDAGTVALLAVSKTFDADAVREAAAAGQRAFGENYVQEALAKQAMLRDLRLEWHFIGPIQSNKTRDIAAHFDWAHGIDRLKIAQRLSDQRPYDLPPLDVCVQVNVSGEASKSGCTPDAAPALCRAVAALPRLRLRGLMAIPAPITPGTDARAPFRLLRVLFESLKAEGLALDTISAGMSEDLEAAIMEGSTMVRIGTAIFGSRTRASDDVDSRA